MGQWKLMETAAKGDDLKLGSTASSRRMHVMASLASADFTSAWHSAECAGRPIKWRKLEIAELWRSGKRYRRVDRVPGALFRRRYRTCSSRATSSLCGTWRDSAASDV